MIFGINTLEFAEIQKIVQNKNKNKTKQKKNFGPEMPYLGILDCRFEKVLSYLKPLSCHKGVFD